MSDYHFTHHTPPLINMLYKAHSAEKVSFHMPGHNRGSSFNNDFPGDLLNTDTTELDSTDDLNDPTGPICQAQDLAAKAFGAAKTYFITTGSTIAIHAVLHATTKSGNKIIVMRNAHKSLINACLLFHLCLIYSTEDRLEATLSNHPDAIAIWITRPDYFGQCMDITRVSTLTHSLNKLLIIDEAHGSHFAFCPSLYPISGLSGGGDIVIQSAHKTIPALTQGSMIHLSRKYLNRFEPHKQFSLLHDIRESISMLTTSSPSFLIAASLDYARQYMSLYGDKKANDLLINIRDFYQSLDSRWRVCFKEDYIQFITTDPNTHTGIISFDFSRLVLNIDPMPFTPCVLVNALEKVGIYVEFYNFTQIVLICKPDNSREDFVQLSDLLNHFIASYPYEIFETDVAQIVIQDNPLKKVILSLEKFYLRNEPCIYDYTAMGPGNSTTEFVPLSNLANHVLATCLIPYPPGIPLFLPGDRLDTDSVELLRYYIENRYKVNGFVFENNVEHTFLTARVKCYVDDSS